jgi:hypothetical protein
VLGATRQWLHPKRLEPTVPLYQRRARKRPKLGRPVKVGPSYAEGWKVERTFALLGNIRRLLVSHKRRHSIFRAFLLVALILVSLGDSAMS